MSAAFPTEIWIVVLSDVLSTYVHSLVLLPPRARCWHGYRIVRSVSRRFKVIADDIWCSAVGNEESWREFGKLRAAVLTGTYDGPDNWCSSPLISAYGAYILGFILQENPGADVDTAIKTYGISHLVFDKDDPITCLGNALPLAYTARKPNCILESDESLQLKGSTERHPDSIALLSERTLMAARASDGSEEITFQLELALSKLQDYLRLKPVRTPQLDRTFIATLKELVRNYPPSEEGDEAQLPVSINRRKLAATVTSFIESWSKEYETIESRKFALHRAAIYGARKPEHDVVTRERSS